MLSQATQLNFSVYFEVASLTILVWDILDNVKNDYRLLFRHPIRLPTMIYFLSRVSVLAWTLLIFISSNTQFNDCTPLETANVALLVVGLSSTMLLSYLRVCAVWRWNRYIVGFFGVSWLSGVAATLTLIRSFKRVPFEGYCSGMIVNGLFAAPFIGGLFNHTTVFLAITYGVCKYTLSGDLTFRDGILLMLGKSLPAFSKALLHDSQISYLIIMVTSAITLAWIYGSPQIQAKLDPFSSFRVALVPPYLALATILICRVYRNTKLELYNTEEPQTSWHVRLGPAESHSVSSSRPIQIAVSHVDERRSDYPTTKPQKSVETLDFGMV